MPKEHCKQVPVKVEKKIPKTKCKKVPDKKCKDIPFFVPKKGRKEGGRRMEAGSSLSSQLLYALDLYMLTR